MLKWHSRSNFTADTMNIFIDIGNTRLKWGYKHGGILQPQPAFAYKQTPWQQPLRTAWQALARPKKLAISSVAAHDMALAVTTLAKQVWADIEIIMPQSMASGYGVKNAYPQPEKLGIDRWLCLIAAWQSYHQAVWVIDCGTAMTIDYLNADGNHTGGVIAPGLTLMKKSLAQNTRALDFSAQHYPPQLANFTQGGIFSGTLYAAVGLIEQVLKQQSAPAMLLLTGGDADLISRHLSQTAVVDPDLVLKGLSIVTHHSL
jgi:type III pantothenate kinase